MNEQPLVERPFEPAIQKPKVEAKKDGGFFKVVVVILGALIVVGLFVNAYFLMKGKEEKPLPAEPTKAALSPTVTPDPTAEWKVYRSEKFGIYFKYPQDWNSKETEHAVGNRAGIVSLESDILSDFASGLPPKRLNYSIEVIELTGDNNVRPEDYILSAFNLIDDKQYIKIVEEKIEKYTTYKTADIPSMSGQLYAFLENKNKGEFTAFALRPYSKDSSYKNQQQAVLIFDQILSTFRFIE